METEKLDNDLWLALGNEIALPRGHALLDGYDSLQNVWEVILRYTGDGEMLQQKLLALDAQIVFEPLLAGYAIIQLPENQINQLVSFPEVVYVEKPQRLKPQIQNAKRQSCFWQVQEGEMQNGNGVWIAVLDSGIDLKRSAFWREDGTSKIAWIYDQEQEKRIEKEEIITKKGEAGMDYSGHGTNVAQIAALCAPGSELVIVKLGRNKENGFILTTNLMRGVYYVLQQAQRVGKPVVFNISYGNAYGSHDGTSLLEQYLNEAAGIGKSCFCVAAGNEASSGGHFAGKMSRNLGEETTVSFVIGSYENAVSLQLWAYAADQFRVSLVSPRQERFILAADTNLPSKQQVVLGQTSVTMLKSLAKPYTTKQEILFFFQRKLGQQEFIDSGIWQVILSPENVKNGSFHMYLPAIEARQENTRFLFPTPHATITIPATAQRVLSVGAYDPYDDAYAPFSGRGFYEQEDTKGLQWQIAKPDLVAPGENILLRDGEQTISLSGTSYATPIVAAAAATVMQWGIVQGNDPFLYGEKVKAVLQRGARSFPKESNVPNAKTGWGKLCVYDSFKNLPKN